MKLNRRHFLALAAGGAAMAQSEAGRVTHYVRYESGGATSFGVLEGDLIHRIAGDLFGARRKTGETVNLSDVRLRYPIQPPKVLAVGQNYRSHLRGRPVPTNPEIFYKPTTSLQDPGGPIVIPPGSKDLHYEGELVIVIGRTGKNIPKNLALDHILGFTCGNDVSERNWQLGSIDKKPDQQWWRGKGSDTFGPMGPSIAVGLDYPKSKIQLRLNGEVKQEQLISDQIFDPPTVVNFISQYVTLEQGDVIFTGTPGVTSAMKAGDEIEVEISGIGTLVNRVRAS
jgi:2-keto-4-pentenoate hydratase/2-oxohepta-3-ene-1,7-dioic acid hydratase in catechol pathway